MMTKNLIAIVAAMSCLASFRASAQTVSPSEYVFVFGGTSSTTDSNGVIVTTPINNQTLLRNFAVSQGVTNYSWLGLAYHVNGNTDFNGDTIDVVNRTNGQTVATLFGLYYGEAFGRMALLSGSGRQMKRLEYIYTSQNSHSLGSALITDYYWLDGNGNTNKTYIFGNMQYLVLPDATHTNVQVCTGNFRTIGNWRFP